MRGSKVTRPEKRALTGVKSGLHPRHRTPAASIKVPAYTYLDGTKVGKTIHCVCVWGGGDTGTSQVLWDVMVQLLENSWAVPLM